ncbi:MAG: HIT domain-containing protein [Candidatus Pacearchaeota archaeon]
MSENCCVLGKAIKQNRLLAQTDNFFVIPTKGSMGIPGYLLIVTKEHYLGFGEVPTNQYSELLGLIDSVKGIIKSEYKLNCLVFEHGPRLNEQSGQSIDHAHLHVVPGVDITKEWAVDMMQRLDHQGIFYRVERVEGFERAKQIMGSKKSYLYVESPSGVQLLSEQNFFRPSQYFRKMVAHQSGSKDWNWRKHPDYLTLEKTVEKLSGKF